MKKKKDYSAIILKKEVNYGKIQDRKVTLIGTVFTVCNGACLDGESSNNVCAVSYQDYYVYGPCAAR
jgi:hypothetical protein